MVSSQTQKDVDSVFAQIVASQPFSSLTDIQKLELRRVSNIVSCKVGDRILRNDALPGSVYLVLDGKVRLLKQGLSGSITLALRGRGQLIGWSSLLCADPFEWVMASEPSILFEIPSSKFISLIKSNKDFSRFFDVRNIHESNRVFDCISEKSHIVKKMQQNLSSL